MSTWLVGDIHGCAGELAELLERLDLGSGDRLVSLGDLYHRGPDPHGVRDLLADLPCRVDVVLGNHEHVLLRRAGIAGRRPDGSDIGRLPASLGPLEADLLRGDGGTPMRNVDPERAPELLRFLEGRSYCLGGEQDGRRWWAVHAGVPPGRRPDRCRPEDLIRLRRLEGLPGAPYWYEVHAGPDLVLFGHTPGRLPRTRFQGERLVALGLDTGCVYGGSLTAWRLEDGELVAVPARRDWTARSR